MAQSLCILGDRTYDYNPPISSNPAIRAVSISEGLTGRVYTDFGSHPSRRDITQQWPTMETEFFSDLQAIALAGGTQPFTDELGQSFTVIVLPPTYEKLVADEAYINVTLKMHVVSQP